MENYMPMGTTDEHNDFVTALLLDLANLIKRREVSVKHENCPLVYYGERKFSTGFRLIDVTTIKDTERFLDNITELENVNPDFMLFKDNPYLKNKKRTRTAGQPDLIVEIWSESNDDNHRAFLKNLYSTSPITEHWYIEQESNRVECYIGSTQLPDQCLTNMLVTQKGLEFDLRYLAV